MQRVITLLLVAVLTVIALAAPTPRAPLSTVRLGSFKAVTSGRRHHHHHHNGTSVSNKLQRNPRAAIERAYRKFNWAITFVTPNGESFTLGLPDGSSSSSSSSSSSGNPFGGSGSSSGSDAGAPSSTAPVTSAVQTGSAAVETGSTAVYSAPATATSSASGATVSGEVSATPEQNESEYLSPVTIGGQTLNLDFDTGSADLYVSCTTTSLPVQSLTS